MSMAYSVLMSVYYKEKSEYLRQSIQSILEQTVLTDDFVLVCDGELSPELNNVINVVTSEHPGLFNVVRLSKNSGLAAAMNEGLKHCRHELVSRMDSDDVSCHDRCARQLAVFDGTKTDIVSGTVAEFDGDIAHIGMVRFLPEQNTEIMAFARTRNPFNHPCVMYRRSAVLQAGGYRQFPLFEDYELWIRMLLNGCKGYNIPDLLLYMRAGEEMYQRRGGAGYCRAIWKFRTNVYKSGFISLGQCISIIVAHCAVAMLPNPLRKMMYKCFLRQQSTAGKNGEN